MHEKLFIYEAFSEILEAKKAKRNKPIDDEYISIMKLMQAIVDKLRKELDL